MENPAVKSPLQIASASEIAKSIRAPVGLELSTKGWHQEAALRMLMNSLDQAVTGGFEDETSHERDIQGVTGGTNLVALIESLRELKSDETLLVESGKPLGVFRTYENAPRVLITNVNNQAEFGTAFRGMGWLGFVLFGQTSAESWTSIGTQAALYATYMTFAAAAQKHFGGDLAGKLIVSGGMGFLGRVQPLAATLNGAAFLGVEAEEEKITRSIRAGYCDYCVNNLDEALRILKVAVRKKQAVSVGLAGNCAEVIPELARRGVLPDLLTDQTGSHDPLQGYIPVGFTPLQAAALRHKSPKDYLEQAYHSIARHVAAIIELQKMGAVTFDFGNRLPAVAVERCGLNDAFEIPHFVAAYLLPLLCEDRRAPVRWLALSGDSSDIRKIDAELIRLFADDQIFEHWIGQAGKHVKFQGLPARTAWLRQEQRVILGDRINQMLAQGELKAPIVIAGDIFDCKTEAGQPLLSALLTIASGASWVAIRGESDTGTNAFQHAAYAVVTDGTSEAALRVRKALTNNLELSLGLSEETASAK